MACFSVYRFGYVSCIGEAHSADRYSVVLSFGDLYLEAPTRNINQPLLRWLTRYSGGSLSFSGAMLDFLDDPRSWSTETAYAKHEKLQHSFASSDSSDASLFSTFCIGPAHLDASCCNRAPCFGDGFSFLSTKQQAFIFSLPGKHFMSSHRGLACLSFLCQAGSGKADECFTAVDVEFEMALCLQWPGFLICFLRKSIRSAPYRTWLKAWCKQIFAPLTFDVKVLLSFI